MDLETSRNDIIIHKIQICTYKMQNIGIHFFQTCWLNCKNVKFDSNSNEEVTCWETYIFISKSIKNMDWNMLK
jgi:hypothetical protein